MFILKSNFPISHDLLSLLLFGPSTRPFNAAFYSGDYVGLGRRNQCVMRIYGVEQWQEDKWKLQATASDDFHLHLFGTYPVGNVNNQSKSIQPRPKGQEMGKIKLNNTYGEEDVFSWKEIKGK